MDRNLPWGAVGAIAAVVATFVAVLQFVLSKRKREAASRQPATQSTYERVQDVLWCLFLLSAVIFFSATGYALIVNPDKSALSFVLSGFFFAFAIASLLMGLIILLVVIKRL